MDDILHGLVAGWTGSLMVAHVVGVNVDADKGVPSCCCNFDSSIISCMNIMPSSASLPDDA